jgi:hypothetical protein
MQDLQQFKLTQQLIYIENFYDDYFSHNRFVNAPDYQKKRKNIETTISGRSKIYALLSRYDVAGNN